MKKIDRYQKIIHENKTYGVIELNYNSQNVPVVMDWDIFKEVKKLDKKWIINNKGFVVTTHVYKNENGDKLKEITLHDIVMKLSDGILEPTPILHINRLGVDNRRINLDYDTNDKEITKNIKKKTRTVVLPKEAGINVDNIPSYIWYVKEDLSHGDRFVVNIGDVVWKSTASKKVSLKYKLEESKKYMRNLKIERPELFDDYSMNGDLNEYGMEMLKEFYAITEKANYKLNINAITNKKQNTNILLEENLDGLTEEEILLLNLFDPKGERHDFR